MHHFSCHTNICYILQREKSSTWRDTCCRAFHVPPELEFPLQCASVEENISHLSRHFWRWFSFSPGEICSFPGGYHMHNIHDAGSLIEMFFVDRMFLCLLAKMRTWFCFGKKGWKKATVPSQFPFHQHVQREISMCCPFHQPSHLRVLWWLVRVAGLSWESSLLGCPWKLATSS